MSRSSIFAPVRALLAPRPAIQAWRVGRCYATTITSERVSAPNLPPVSATFQSAQDGPFVSGSVGQSAQSSDLAPQDIRIESARAAPEQTNVAAEPLGTKAIPVGVVVSAGKMQKTVKVRIPGMKFHKHLRKLFKTHSNHLVHDPNSSTRIGDVISMTPFKTAKHVGHVVKEILVPFGEPIEARPPVPTEEERAQKINDARAAKQERRQLRHAAASGSKEAIDKLRAMGADAGQGVQVGVSATKKDVQKGRVGKQGQKLPEGVLPGGKHAVGKIQERAMANRQKADKLNEKAQDNLLEAKALKEQTQQ